MHSHARFDTNSFQDNHEEKIHKTLFKMMKNTSNKEKELLSRAIYDKFIKSVLILYEDNKNKLNFLQHLKHIFWK